MQFMGRWIRGWATGLKNKGTECVETARVGDSESVIRCGHTELFLYLDQPCLVYDYGLLTSALCSFVLVCVGVRRHMGMAAYLESPKNDRSLFILLVSMFPSRVFAS